MSRFWRAQFTPANNWVCYEVCLLCELARHHALTSWCHKTHPRDNDCTELRLICHCTVERLSICLKFANIQRNSRSCLLGLTVIRVHMHSVYVDLSVFLHQWSRCIVHFTSAPAEPHEIRVHLVRLTYQACEDPVQHAVLSICGSTIDSADVVCDLGVWLDSELTMNHHKRSLYWFLPPSEVAAAPRRGQPGDHEAAGDVASIESYGLL